MDMNHWGELKHYWYVACESSELRQKPISRQVLGQPLVLFRDQSGQPVALLDRCPHRNVALSVGWVQADRLVCRYHGWQFDRLGQCQRVPGRGQQACQPLRTVPCYATVEQSGWVWVYAMPSEIIGPTLGGNRSLNSAMERQTLPSPPSIPLMDQKRTGHFRFQLTAQTTVLNAAENFLDGLHTHFVHGGLIRREGSRQRMQVQITRTPEQVEAIYKDEASLSGLIYRLLGTGSQQLISIGRFILPGMAQLEYQVEGAHQLFITLFLTPEDDHKVRGYGVVTFQWRWPNWLGIAIAKPLFQLALYQDRAILQQQAQNIERFGRERFTSTELDVMRPHLEALLQGARAGVAVKPQTQTVDLWL